MAGRGFGKTRTGAEWVKEKIKGEVTEPCRRIALVAPTAADCRDVMVMGESGLLAVFGDDPKWKPAYKPSKRRIDFPNGAIATLYSADKPARLRGPQHDGAWSDEIGAWRYPEARDHLQFGLRLGDNPQDVATTTPRPTRMIKEMVSDSSVHVTAGNTYENSAHLAQAFLDTIRRKYEGTRLGKQEIYAQILGDVVGALWNQDMLDALRVSTLPKNIYRTVVSVDPPAGSKDMENSAECGIVVVALVIRNGMPYGYVLDDRSLIARPREWAEAVVEAYDDWDANYVIGEANNGGDLVEFTLRTVRATIPFKKVWASKGKHTRAEPVSSLYEQAYVKHVGYFPELEEQMCSWVPGMKSPDRMDAMVWGFTDLIVSNMNFDEVNEDAVVANDGPFQWGGDDWFNIEDDIFKSERSIF